MLSGDENIIDHPVSHFLFASISYLFFACVWNFLLRYQIGWNTLAKPSGKNHWDLVDNITALAYLTAVVIWVLAWAASGDIWKDPFLAYTTSNAYFFAVCLGRFLHHLTICIVNDVGTPSFHFHHALMSFFLTLILLTQTAQRMVLQGMFMEIGSISLCIRPMLTLTGRSKGILFEVNKYVSVTAMAISRIVGVTFLAYSFYHYSHNMPYYAAVIISTATVYLAVYSTAVTRKLFHKNFMMKN